MGEGKVGGIRTSRGYRTMTQRKFRLFLTEKCYFTSTLLSYEDLVRWKKTGIRAS